MSPYYATEKQAEEAQRREREHNRETIRLAAVLVRHALDVEDDDEALARDLREAAFRLKATAT